MAHALPLTKLAGLIIKTLSKPVSKQIQHQMSKSAGGKQILVTIGQSYHNITSRMTIWGAGYKVRSITPLDDKLAVKEGAELVGETFVFSVSIGWLLYEYNNAAIKSREADEAKRAKATAEREALRTQLHAIDVRLEALETALENSTRIQYRAPPEKKHIAIAAPVLLEGEKDTTIERNSSRQPPPPPPKQQQQQQPPTTNNNNNDDNTTAWWRQIWPF
mmetsp:Transcript_8693/g.16567  ORF Transcript_8693/g.16567 Transcript_8693/m.16567 type:complete len:219 (-) Transcript_8693:183-839(-)